MAVVERRTIDELIATYRLEPSTRDVIVEGRRDRGLLSWFLSSSGIRDVPVLEVDHVDVPSALIASRGLAVGRRGALMTLALEVFERLGQDIPQLTCIADRDGEDVEPFAACGILQFTDFASLEMYLFDVRVLSKVVTAVAGKNVDADAVLQRLRPILRTLFAIRRANLVLRMNLDWLSFQRCCVLDDGSVQFDADDFIQRFLSKGAQLSAAEIFVAEVQKQLAAEIQDDRLHVNGHDYIELLAWYLDKAAIMRGAKPDDVERLLVASAEHAWLAEHGLFRTLLARVRA